MIQGTASSVGKSVLCCALLRIFRQDGLSVAPFKAQNMALNSFVTRDGREMGRAQVTQAQAAGIEPDVRMNPVLLKPTSDRRSQVIVNGRAIGTMSAMEYQRMKPSLREMIRETYDALEAAFDAVIIEGAGSPAEINLRDGDIVNMAMAETADAPVLLVGDIDLGGVFASLYGTVMLLEPHERARIRGLIINKFRGDIEILKPGLRMIEERVGIPVLGVVPYMDVRLEEEDGASARFDQMTGDSSADALQFAVIRLAHISNFTDFQALSLQPGVRVRYVTKANEISDADVVILPGTKNTIDDLLDIRHKGIDAEIVRHARRGGLVIGICGGFQMLGTRLCDPLHVEASVPEAAGLGLIDMEVIFEAEKRTRQAQGVVDCPKGWLKEMNGLTLDGYEIHAGQSRFGAACVPWLRIDGQIDGVCNEEENVLGSYLHGLFDSGELIAEIAAHVRGIRGERGRTQRAANTLEAFREQEFDRIAAIVRESLDMKRITAILRGEA